MAARLTRVVLALYFLNVAAGKLFGAAVWVSTFDRLGGSQTGRYVTGALQLAGAILILIPRTQTAGAALLAVTMLGATFAWTFVLRDPVNAIWSGLILAVLVGLAFLNRPKPASVRA
jgi:putative oxidoreductase